MRLLKYMMAASLSIFAMHAFAGGAGLSSACPELRGTYSCSVEGENAELIVNQSSTSEATTYTLDMEGDVLKVVSDQQWRPYEIGENYSEGLYNASCKNSATLSITIKEDINDTEYGHMTIEKKASDLLAITQVRHFDDGETKEEINIVCVTK